MNFPLFPQNLQFQPQLNLHKLISFTLIAAALASSSCSQVATLAIGDLRDSCSRLTGMAISSVDIGLPTSGATITESTWVESGAPGNTNGEYCKVLGAIHPVSYSAPDINFEINLPEQWNQKSLQFGGGGLNGTVVTGLGWYAKQPRAEQTPLAMGYVTMGSDSGHQSRGGFDGSFYLNKEALENFGHMQIKKTHDVAMLMVAEFYGKPPVYDYFIGGSQGGHEAFDAAQRFPEDYDGVVAGYPAHNVVMLHLSALNYAKALHANEGHSWLNPEEVGYLRQTVYAACDGLDGVDDGIISDVNSCRLETAAFKLMDNSNPLRCANGVDAGDSCLSDFQLEALKVMDEPYDLGFSLFADDEGNSYFPKWTPFEGSTFVDGGSPNLGANGAEQALQLSAGDSTSRLAITQNINYDTVNDFDPLEWAGRIAEITPVLSANSTNLDEFRDRGGKLLTFHGLVDDYITPYSSIQYYERLLGRYEVSELSEFYRFYTVPGMGHVTGPFSGTISSLSYLETWVEEGISPVELVAADANRDTSGRTRPVCHYPLWPKYNGSGDANQASNFTCVR